MMKSSRFLSYVALTIILNIPSIVSANHFFAQITHSEKAAQIQDTTTYLDYLEWSAVEELYKHATTSAPATVPTTPTKPGVPAPKLVETPLSLFTFPKAPEARFWFWMSKEDTVKKEKLNSFIEMTKELVSAKPAEKLFELIIEHSLRTHHKPTLQKARELLTRTKTTNPLPFVERTLKQLDQIEVNALTEKIQSSQNLDAKEKKLFLSNLENISDLSTQIETLNKMPKKLLEEKEFLALFSTIITKPLSEKDVDSILDNTSFLKLASEEELKKLLQYKEAYARENFWLQKISQIAKETPRVSDVEELSKQEDELINQLEKNRKCIFFIRENLVELTKKKFMSIVSHGPEEKPAVHAVPEKLEKK